MFGMGVVTYRQDCYASTIEPTEWPSGHIMSAADQISNSYLIWLFQCQFIQAQIEDEPPAQSIRSPTPRSTRFRDPSPDDPKEQEAIAEALSDVDALIEGLERLIAKKRLIKQGAMQDLLTAKRRLPGFSEEWVERSYRLEKLRSQVGSRSPQRVALRQEVGPRLIRNCDLRSHSDPIFFSGDYSDAYLVRPGEILIGTGWRFLANHLEWWHCFAEPTGLAGLLRVS